MTRKTIKNQFPLLTKHPQLIYLDAAATSLKPQPVIDAITTYYTDYSANVHRGIYAISERATDAYEDVRKKVAAFINAPSVDEIIFTKGTTEGINLLATCLGQEVMKKGDEILVSIMEHHSNLVPWQQLSPKIHADLKFIEITKDGELRMTSDEVRIVALTHVSNVLGTINPIQQIAHEVRKLSPGTLMIIDGAQAVGHMPVDVQTLGCDAYVFSGHKMFGPTGVGVVWLRKELLENISPYQFGGSMIRRVERQKTSFADPPAKFEAGTPPIAQVIGLGAAIDFIERIGREKMRRHAVELTTYALEQLDPLVKIFGPKDPERRGGLVAFSVDGIHAHDVAQMLDEDNIAVRAGHHCTMPLHQALGIPATVRASFSIYNTKEDIDRLVASIKKAMEKLKK